MVRHPPVTIPPGDTILDVLRWRAEQQPDQTAYTFLREGLNADAVLTYGELVARARSIAGYLHTRFAPGARLLLVYPPGLEFVQAFGERSTPASSPCRFRLQTHFARGPASCVSNASPKIRVPPAP